MNLSLHHIGYLVPHIDEARETYMQQFGYKIHSPVIHDPVQTALVQFLRLPADSSYLELISPAGEQSRLSAALAKGGGLNHLCYRTTDLDAEIARMRSSGLLLLRKPVPAVAFGGRRIAWMRGQEPFPIELVEAGNEGEL